MIDWLTLRLPLEHLLPGDQAALMRRQAWMIRTKPGWTDPNADQGGGPLNLIEWQTPCRESIRSDTHRLLWYMNLEYLELSGSPARLGRANNVFGKRCMVECAQDMIEFFRHAMDCYVRAPLTEWVVSRSDITLNYALRDEGEVREALRCLSAVEGGHYRVQSTSGTVYWNKLSRLRTGKAYHKGPHLAFQVRKNQADASDDEIALANRLLRLELALRGQYWRERAVKPWYEWSADELEAVHAEYFGAMIGTVEVVEVGALLERCKSVARTPGQGACAYNTWLAIRSEGLEQVRARMARATWQRHKKLLFMAGLTWADFQASNVVPLRRRTIELGAPVHTWDELRRAA